MAGTIVANTLNTDTGIYSTNNAYNGIAKAWVNFNATGPSIYSSFNVGSITFNANGDFNVNFTTAIGNTNYAYSIGVTADGSVSASYLTGSKSAAMFSTYLKVSTAYLIPPSTWAGSNPTSVSVVIFSA